MWCGKKIKILGSHGSYGLKKDFDHHFPIIETAIDLAAIVLFFDMPTCTRELYKGIGSGVETTAGNGIHVHG